MVATLKWDGFGRVGIVDYPQRMASKTSLAKDYIARVMAERSVDEIEAQLASDTENLPARMPISAKVTPELLDRRWERLEFRNEVPADLESMRRSITRRC